MKKKNQLLCFAMLVGLSVSAQNSNHAYSKSTKTICSLVSEGDAGRIAKTSPLILYMQDSVNNKKIEIVFTQAMRKHMSYDPYAKLVDQTVCVTGKITSYNNSPAIIISSESQIKTNDKSQVGRNNANE